MKNNNKLLEFPYVYYINLDRSPQRREYVENHFSDFGITEYERVAAEDVKQHTNLEFLENGLPKGLKPVEAVVVYSHIKALKKFIDSKKEWCLIFEDDIDLSISNYWNFSWKDFFDRLPKDTEVAQLVVATRKTRTLDFHLHQRKFWDFNATAYLIKRSHAIDVIGKYCNNDKINLQNYKIYNEYDLDNSASYSQEKYATIEEVLYGINKWNIYSAPIFGYSMEFESISNPEHYEQSLNSNLRVLDYWKNQHKYFSIEEYMRA